MLPLSDPRETSRTVTYKSTSISPHFSLSQYLSVRYICKNSLKTMRLEIVNCFVVPKSISPTSLIKAQIYLFHGIGKANLVKIGFNGWVLGSSNFFPVA
jgi:hypothetical protein